MPRDLEASFSERAARPLLASPGLPAEAVLGHGRLN